MMMIMIINNTTVTVVLFVVTSGQHEERKKVIVVRESKTVSSDMESERSGDSVPTNLMANINRRHEIYLCRITQFCTPNLSYVAVSRLAHTSHGEVRP
jgi:hypothetical protein